MPRTQYKHYWPFESECPPGVWHGRWTELRSLSDRVCSRCGVLAWFNTRRHRLAFGTIDPTNDRAVVMHEEQTRQEDGTYRPIGGLDHEISEDAICWAIGLARVPVKQKMAWAQAHENRVESDLKSERQKVNNHDDFMRFAEKRRQEEARVSVAM